MKKWRKNFVRGQCLLLVVLLLVFAAGCNGNKASADSDINNDTVISDTAVPGNTETGITENTDKVENGDEEKDTSVDVITDKTTDDETEATDNTSNVNTGSSTASAPDNSSNTTSGNTGSVPNNNSNTGSGTTDNTQQSTPATNPSTNTSGSENKPESDTPTHTHSYTAANTVAPTCTADGYTTYKCSCGNVYNDDVVGATGHSWSEWSTMKEATTSEEGQQSRTCSSCGATETEPIAKVPEPEVTLDYSAAEAYGNSYAASAYGWIIDYSLNSGNAGYYPGTTVSVEYLINNGGQSELNYCVSSCVAATKSALDNRGDTGIFYVNCDVIDNGNGTLSCRVYYG